MSDYITRVIDEASTAVRRRVWLNTKASETLGVSNDASDKKKMDRQVRAYERQLKSVHNAVVSKGKPQVDEAIKRIFEGYAPRLLATVRATLSDQALLPYAILEERANDLSLFKAYHETVAVVPAPTKRGSWRPIALSGKRRKAQQLILRDILLITIGDSTHDSTVPGAGGEAQLFKDITTAIADGYHYWASLDIRNFFPSLRPGHLEEFPLSKWVIRNLVFLPLGAPIRFVDPECGIELSEQAVLEGGVSDLPPYYPYSTGGIAGKLKMVRQGLLQGDVCAPQIARTVLGRELRLTLENGAACVTYLDDILLGARSQLELKASSEALACRLKSHPAGPLEFHTHDIRHVSDGFYYLGYRIRLLANGKVHVNPASKRFDRFRDRLTEHFKASDADTSAKLGEIGIEYAKHWFNSQKPWTKTESSWGYVLGEVNETRNSFIHDEYIGGIGSWSEADVDFDLLDT